jgi:biotin-(acetyl-CoA carboxylase) ligase
VVVGIGINVSQTESQLPAGTVTPAGSILTTTGRLVGRAALLADVLDHLESGYEQWLTDGLEALVVELERRNALRGLDVIAGGAPARVARIDTSGQLVVITASGEERAIASGEIEVQQWSRPS